MAIIKTRKQSRQNKSGANKNIKKTIKSGGMREKKTLQKMSMKMSMKKGMKKGMKRGMKSNKRSKVMRGGSGQPHVKPVGDSGHKVVKPVHVPRPVDVVLHRSGSVHGYRSSVGHAPSAPPVGEPWKHPDIKYQEEVAKRLGTTGSIANAPRGLTRAPAKPDAAFLASVKAHKRQVASNPTPSVSTSTKISPLSNVPVLNTRPSRFTDTTSKVLGFGGNSYPNPNYVKPAVEAT